MKRKYKREMDNYYDISEYYIEKTKKLGCKTGESLLQTFACD